MTGMTTLQPRTRRAAPSNKPPVLAVALFLGAVQLLLGALTVGRPSYWGDEAATLSVATRPLPDIIALLARVDAVHGLYYVIQGAFMALVGTTPFPARMLSVAAIAATVSLTVILGDRLAGLRVGIYAGMIASFLPGLIWAGAELRSPALTALSAVLVILALERATRKRSITPWVVYALALTFSVWLFVFSALLAIPAAALAASRARTRPFLLFSAAAGIASLPIVIISSRQVDQVSWISDDPAELIGGVLVGQYFYGQRPYDAFSTPTAYFAVAVAAISLSMVAWYTRSAFRDRDLRVWTVTVAWTVAPTLLLVSATLIGKPLYLERYLTFTAPGMCILLGAALASLPRRPASATLLAFCLLVTPVLAGQKLEGSKPDNYAALARFVDQRKEPGAAAIYSAVRARGLPTSYPDQFEGVENVALDAGPLDTGSFWGRTTPAPALDVDKVADRQVFAFTTTVYADAYPDAVDPLMLLGAEPYLLRLLDSGCTVSGTSTVTTFTAYVLDC